MITQINDVIGADIFEPVSGELLGKINKVIIDPETGKILAFLNRSNLSAASVDVYFDLNDRLCSKTKNLWVPLTDLLRVNDLYQNKHNLYRQKVVSETGTKLGKICNMQFDPVNFVVTHLITQKAVWIFKCQFLIPAKNIVNVTPRTVTVKDNLAYGLKGRGLELRANELGA